MSQSQQVADLRLRDGRNAYVRLRFTEMSGPHIGHAVVRRRTMSFDAGVAGGDGWIGEVPSSMKRYIRNVLASAAGLLLALTVPSAATADVYGWSDAARCATGMFTGYVVGPPNLAGPLVLSGRIGPCRPNAGVSGRFGFAYPAGRDVAVEPPQPGRVYEPRLRSYASATGQTLFSGHFDFRTASSFGHAQMPVCLMKDLYNRLACVIVELAPDGTPTVTQTSTFDPRVGGPLVLYTPGTEHTPNCGTCL